MQHLLAVRDDGTIWGWGSTYAFDSAGQKMRRISRPQQIGDETDWVAAHAIDGSSIGIKADGIVWAWNRSMRIHLDFEGAELRSVAEIGRASCRERGEGQVEGGGV